MGHSIGVQIQALRQDGWQGLGSDAFYGEMNEKVAPGIRKLREALEEASQEMAKIASIFGEAEETARAGLGLE